MRLKPLILAAIALLAAATPAFAQDPIPGQSPREAARAQSKHRDRVQIERDYQQMRRTQAPAPNMQVDPWAGVREQDQGKK